LHGDGIDILLLCDITDDAGCLYFSRDDLDTIAVPR
jgi:hypothetical protein